MRFLKTLITGFFAAGCLILLLPSPVYGGSDSIDVLGEILLQLGPPTCFTFITFGQALVIVIFIEGAVIFFISRLKFRRALYISFLANIASVVCGSILGLCQYLWLPYHIYFSYWLITIIIYCILFTCLGWFFTRSWVIATIIITTMIFGASFTSAFYSDSTQKLANLIMYLLPFPPLIIILSWPLSFGITLGSQAGIFRAFLPSGGLNENLTHEDIKLKGGRILRSSPGSMTKTLLYANICAYGFYLIVYLIWLLLALVFYSA